MVVALKSYKVLIVIIAGVGIGILLSCITYWPKNHEVSKADRSNSMQVNKVIFPESVMTASGSDFFTEYRMERDKLRSERSEVLQASIKNAKTDESIQQAQEAVLKIIVEKEREAEIEGLIKAHGFADALVFLWENSASIVVKTSSLTREEVENIANIVTRVSGVKTEDITIRAKP
ncbi:hypothetical protein P22_3570 [Propionispora sp. 2/2-37]|uniref:SpoIIIAH-like family protein n=1 Tax=Propionispora sp. 2/2-37 TaxID=1677858 RepID=UPI0006BB5643|nr:SpoIIIAH-like family protein [Propionispora sp. 2/2-37]CUH97440.1 hypothetical protein P22_3570 [Propionispora sp. 2/2-37]